MKWLLARCENVVDETRFSYIWGPFETDEQINTWKLEFYNRLCEEYTVDLEEIESDTPPKVKNAEVRSPEDLDGREECMIYDENVWGYTSLNQLNI